MYNLIHARDRILRRLSLVDFVTLAAAAGAGICSGFTTFSTFSLDAFHLMERGELLAAACYMIASVALSIGALVMAMRWVRAWLDLPAAKAWPHRTGLVLFASTVPSRVE